jgi:hypothetical protein
MLFSDFNKVMPLLKNGFFVKWLDKDEQNGWYSYSKFAQDYNFKKIQVIKCRNKCSYSYNADFDFELTLKKIIT